MDPTTINALIAAGAALVGASLGVGGSLLSAGRQHRLTSQSETRKQVETREREAAEACSSAITKLSKLVRNEQGVHEGEEEFTQRVTETTRLNDELRVESLYLPTDLRQRILTAMSFLDDASDMYSHGHFYRAPTVIASFVADDINTRLAAFVRKQDAPDDTDIMRRLAVASEELDNERHDLYAVEVDEYEEPERRWLDKHPEFKKGSDATGTPPSKS